MKKIVSLLFSAFISLTLAAQDTIPNLLFIGNSYTYVNDLPSLIDSVAASTGRRYTHGSNTPGGAKFSDHCTNESMTMIQQGGWDYVVLQEQSQLPSFPQSQVDVECLPYAKQLADSVKAHGGIPMFYMTWGRKNGDQQNAQYFPVLGTYEGMDSMIYERYMQMAIDNQSAVCPVGRVWRFLRTNNPEIELYDSDESHPSLAGSYAAACAFYVMLFNADPDSITYDATLKSTEALAIRNAASTVVYDNYSYWIDPANYQDPDPDPDPDPTSLKNVSDDVEPFVVYDIQGRVVLRENEAFDSLPAGIYIKVGKNSGKATKFIKR